MLAKVTPCKQEFLEQKYPGEGRVCKNASEREDFLKDLEFQFFVLNQYFDEKEYHTHPIKPYI